MNDDPRLRRAFQDAVLPPAPEALHARLEEIARRPAPAPRALPGRLGLLVAAAAIALVALAVALSGGGLTLTPTGTPSPPPTGLAHFDEGGLVFDYPAGWRVYHYQEVSSFTSVVAFLATVDVPIPCATTVTSDSTGIDCADRYVLAPDSLVVTVMANGTPTFDISNVPAGATPLVVGGLPAYFETEPARSGGDTETLTWTLSRPGSVDNYYAIRAAIRGPHLGPFEAALHDLIAGLRYNLPVVPPPSPSPSVVATASPTTFSFDVENRSHVPVIVSVTSDAAAVLPGFEPGQRGTISISLLNPQNGIRIEVQGVGCQLLASGDFPTPVPFTLVVEDATGAKKVQLSTSAGTSSSPLPLPTNSLVGCGG